MRNRYLYTIFGAILSLFIVFTVAAAPADKEQNKGKNPLDGIASIRSLLPHPDTLSPEERLVMSRMLMEIALEGIDHLDCHVHFDNAKGKVIIHTNKTKPVPKPKPKPKTFLGSANPPRQHVLRSSSARS